MRHVVFVGDIIEDLSYSTVIYANINALVPEFSYKF